MADDDFVMTLPAPDLWWVYESQDDEKHMAIFSSADDARDALGKSTTALCGVKVTPSEPPGQNGEPLRVCEACKAMERQRRVVTKIR